MQTEILRHSENTFENVTVTAVVFAVNSRRSLIVGGCLESEADQMSDERKIALAPIQQITPRSIYGLASTVHF